MHLIEVIKKKVYKLHRSSKKLTATNEMKQASEIIKMAEEQKNQKKSISEARRKLIHRQAQLLELIDERRKMNEKLTENKQKIEVLKMSSKDCFKFIEDAKNDFKRHKEDIQKLLTESEIKDSKKTAGKTNTNKPKETNDKESLYDEEVLNDILKKYKNDADAEFNLINEKKAK